ncbi:RHS repeat domain-containing protein [Paraflavitalea sp. sgz302552]
MLMPNRSYTAGTQFRYGFNGKENDVETTFYDYGFRIYDSKICRFKSVDPLFQSFPHLTVYQYSSNNPIANIDIDGLEGKCVITEQFQSSFIEKHNLLQDDHVKNAIYKNQTVIMKLTYAKGPDDKDSKDVMLNDGGEGAAVLVIEMQTNGVTAQWGNLFESNPLSLRKSKISVKREETSLSINSPSKTIDLPSPDAFVKKITKKTKKRPGFEDLDINVPISNLFILGTVDVFPDGQKNGSISRDASISDLKRYRNLLRDIRESGSVESVSISLEFRVGEGLDSNEKSAVDRGIENTRRTLKRDFEKAGVPNVDINIKSTSGAASPPSFIMKPKKGN